ncbi:PQQ-dependent sugar dehydrogenase [Halostella sp. JP-L12]|uniref:PQQ-dependent sugar dehydrogenase n=1 Tax=Halostella TaxID=1843185 RepID=UPI000EF78835|nr:MULTISPECIES: PQQ-dependent sugar dehydrogenase [Halostella]NHN49479.1 PQQ-dependent sugar dehydrogenase [Halostella sp. JP-L12]
MDFEESRFTRRQFLGAGIASVVGTAAGMRLQSPRWGLSRGETSPVVEGPEVGLEPVVSDLYQPIAMAFPRGDPSVCLIAEKTGVVRRHDADGLRDEPFLDVSDQLAEPETWEMGFLGFELHPDFAANGKCYARYSAPLSSDAPDHYSHTFVLSEFTAPGDRRRADPATERVLLAIPEPGTNHNAGAIAFGPDGYLYVATGDGRSGDMGAGRGHADDWYVLNRGGNGQDTEENLHGSVLRIDVDDRDDGKPYAVPDDNPLVGEAGLDEHWAWGFRNPYQISFGPDGRLFVGDVGSNRFEEVNVVRRGGNYGWNVREGKRCVANRYVNYALAKLPFARNNWPACPSATSDGEPLVDPVVIYPHQRDGEPFGRAVIGGRVHDGDALPDLQGKYVFGDFLGDGRAGQLFAASPDDDPLWTMQELRPTVDGEPFEKYVLSFAGGPSGETYVLASRMAEESGAVYRLTDPP